jgi:predicted kinase
LTAARTSDILHLMVKTLTLMQGIPGSGKTTVAAQLSSATGAAIFSTDDFWLMASGVYDYDPNRIAEAHQWNQREVAKAMAAEEYSNIIIDNTNIKREHIEPYRVLANIFGYEVRVVRVDVPVNIAILRQFGRSDERQVPEDVIRKMHDEMEDLL